MKKSILFFAVLLMLSCNSEELNPHFVDPTSEPETETPVDEPNPEPEANPEGEPEPEPENEFATIDFTGKIALPNTSATEKVPSCSTDDPASLKIVMLDSSENEFIAESPISITDGEISTSEQMTAPYGVNIVSSIELLSESGETVYSVPEQVEAAFSTNFFAVKVPFELEVTQTGPNEINATLTCLGPTEIDLEDAFDVNFEMITMQAFYFEKYFDDRCLDEVVIQVDNEAPITVITYTRGYYYVMIPRNYKTLTVTGYNNDPDPMGDESLEHKYTFTDQDPYNPDGKLTLEDVLRVKLSCN